MLKRVAVLVGLLVVLAPTLARADVTPDVPLQAQNNKFFPKNATADLGDTVGWTNNDPVDHTALSDRGDWSQGLPANSGPQNAIEFDYVGKYAYHCPEHKNMTGNIILVPMPDASTHQLGVGFTLTWATGPVGPFLFFDIQYKKAGATTYKYLYKNSNSASGPFNPSHKGTYLIRGRTHTPSFGTTGWAGPLILKVT